MPKFIELRNTQLKELLRINGLSTAGTKCEMAARLTAELNTDEASEEDLERYDAEGESVESQLAEMKAAIGQLMEAMKKNSTQEVAATDNSPPPARSLSQSPTPTIDNNRVSMSVTRNIFSVREIGEIIPEFDPTNEKSVSAEQFVDHIESAKSAYGFDTKCLLLAVCSRLRGAARLWLDGQIKLFQTWEAFRNALLDEFGVELNEAEVSYKMTNCIRRYDEKVADYCFRINALGKRYGLSEVAIIRYAREGLKNREMQSAIAASKFTTMKQLRETLEDYVTNAPTTTRHVSQSVNTKTDPRKFEVRETSKVEANNPRGPRCFNCSEKGHISRNCPNRQRKDRCAICQKTSHKTENCYSQKPEVSNKPPNVNTICETENTYQAVTKEVKINGNYLKAFIDSGSALSLIRETAVPESGDVIACHTVLKGFAGGEYISNNRLNATIEIDNQICTVQLYVVKDYDIPEKVLIGRDVICQEGVRFVFEGGNCQAQTLSITRVEDLLTTTQQQDLNKILDDHEGCFSNDIAGLGKCSTAEMVIKLTTDQPVNIKPYRIPFAKRNIVAEIIDDLMSNEIIQPTTSDYASPVVVVEKKNGEHRLCVDYRCLNKITIKTPFPMPMMEEQFTQLVGNKYFTSLDLRMGYHQIKIHDESKKYTAFVTTEGHYEFNRMPFGLVNAPAVFQRVMNVVISELKPGEALAYLDDIIIPSKTIEEGLQSLRNFLHVLGKHGLTLRPDKCRYLQPEIQYLGHIINHEGIKPGKSKVSAIENFKVPENTTEVRRFLGLTGFFRKFVADYALITSPITKLLGKAERDNFHWNTEQQVAFESLIQKLTNAPVLELYDMSQHHEVHTDACSIGLAGILLQSRDMKAWKPVMYYSRKCTEAEQRYHSYELEVLAVVETLQRFRLYLLGKPFRIITDCEAIARTKDEKELKPRIARWWMRLQEYNYTTQHRPGSRLAHVDAMSRTPDEPPKTPEPAGFVYEIGMDTTDWIVAMQQQDERARIIADVLNGKIQTTDDNQIKRDFILKKQRVYYKKNDELKLYVPKATRLGLVAHYHDNMGHFATEKMVQRVQKLFWFPKMRKIVKDYVKACIECCYNKNNSNKSEGQMHCTTPDPIPFRLLHMDHLGPFIRSKKGNSYVFVITDAFSKFSIVKPVRNTKTTGVLNS